MNDTRYEMIQVEKIKAEMRENKKQETKIKLKENRFRVIYSEKQKRKPPMKRNHENGLSLEN